MLMHQFHKLSVHASSICTVQFVLAVQSASSGLESLLSCYCFRDRNNPERKSVVWQYSPVIGASFPFGKKKLSKRYIIEIACSALAEKAFEKCQRRLNLLKNNIFVVHRLLDNMKRKTKHCSRGPVVFPHFHKTFNEAS